MLIHSLIIPVSEFERGTGWKIKTEGACKGDLCIPLPKAARITRDMADMLDVSVVAEAMHMPIVEEPSRPLWALGPESIGGRALLTAKAPPLELPDVDGNLFDLSSLLGQKIVIYAWAPY